MERALIRVFLLLPSIYGLVTGGTMFDLKMIVLKKKNEKRTNVTDQHKRIIFQKWSHQTSIILLIG